jgi:hypothetical protein
MPFPGEVYRQTQSPILWVKGVHALDRLYVRDLCSDSPPVRQTPVDPDALLVSDLDDTQSIQGDSDDEDEIDEETTADRRDGDGRDGDGREGIGTEDFFEDGGFGDEGFVGAGLDEKDGLDGDEDDAERMERMAEFAELREKGDAKKEILEFERQRLRQALDAVDEALTYPSTHPHLHEVPETAEAWLTHSERLEWTRSQRSFPTTFGTNRRGNVFAPL